MTPWRAGSEPGSGRDGRDGRDGRFEGLPARQVAEELGLEPHREGGYFRETYRAAAKVRTEAGPRPLSTAILYLLTADGRGAPPCGGEQVFLVPGPPEKTRYEGTEGIGGDIQVGTTEGLAAERPDIAKRCREGSEEASPSVVPIRSEAAAPRSPNPALSGFCSPTAYQTA